MATTTRAKVLEPFVEQRTVLLTSFRRDGNPCLLDQLGGVLGLRTTRSARTPGPVRAPAPAREDAALRAHAARGIAHRERASTVPGRTYTAAVRRSSRRMASRAAAARSAAHRTAWSDWSSSRRWSEDTKKLSGRRTSA